MRCQNQGQLELSAVLEFPGGHLSQGQAEDIHSGGQELRRRQAQAHAPDRHQAYRQPVRALPDGVIRRQVDDQLDLSDTQGFRLHKVQQGGQLPLPHQLPPRRVDHGVRDKRGVGMGPYLSSATTRRFRSTTNYLNCGGMDVRVMDPLKPSTDIYYWSSSDVAWAKIKNARVVMLPLNW